METVCYVKCDKMIKIIIISTITIISLVVGLSIAGYYILNLWRADVWYLCGHDALIEQIAKGVLIDIQSKGFTIMEIGENTFKLGVIE